MHVLPSFLSSPKATCLSVVEKLEEGSSESWSMALTKPKAGMEGTGSTSPSWLNCRLKSTAGVVQSDGFPRGPSLYYVSKGTEWLGSEKIAIFTDVQYYLCWRRVSGWVRKTPKICWRNIGMVPREKLRRKGAGDCALASDRTILSSSAFTALSLADSYKE